MSNIDVLARIHPTDYHWILVSLQDPSGAGVKGLQPENFKVSNWSLTPPPYQNGFGSIGLDVILASQLLIGSEPGEGRFYELKVSDPYDGESESYGYLVPPLVYLVEVSNAADQGHTLSTSDRWWPYRP